MPKLESNLLYASAQQTKPWRAGTPGRAPRCRRAVVDIRRPLCLFVVVAALLFHATPSSGQQSPSKTASLQVRAGVMVFTDLVQDDLSGGGSSVPNQSSLLVIKQRVAPALAVAAAFPLRERTVVEVSAGLAASGLDGSDDFESWDMGSVTLANALLGVGYAFTPSMTGHGAIGLTRLFGDQQLLKDGNGIRPLLEAGVSFAMPFHPALRLDARAQAHRFITTALQNEGATEGNVLRFVIAGGYTLRGAR